MTFRDHNVWLLPVENEFCPMVAVECAEARITPDDGFRLLRQFISAIVWMKGQVAIIRGSGGGTYPYRMQIPSERQPPGTMDIAPHFNDLPEPEDERAILGLALYREAMEFENVAYKVFGFAKVFNVLYAEPDRQIEWINNHINKINKGADRLKELQDQGVNVGKYLYGSCRCAVAHAFGDPIVNPDEPDDYKRLGRDLDLVRELSEIAIEKELGVKSAMTVYREHLYELAGFRELLGQELVDLLKSQKLADEKGIELPDFPRLTIRLRDEDPYDALTAMEVENIEVQQDGMVRLECRKAEGISAAYIYLNVPDERLMIDIEGGFAVYDAGTVESARFAADICMFQGKYFLNGTLEVWDADNDRLMGRCDPFVPTNIMPVETWKNFKAHADRFMEIAGEREAEGKSKKKRLNKEASDKDQDDEDDRKSKKDKNK